MRLEDEAFAQGGQLLAQPGPRARIREPRLLLALLRAAPEIDPVRKIPWPIRGIRLARSTTASLPSGPTSAISA
jgi:hypothetical protein